MLPLCWLWRTEISRKMIICLLRWGYGKLRQLPFSAASKGLDKENKMKWRQRERRQTRGFQPTCPEVSSQEKGGNLRAEGRKSRGRTETEKNKERKNVVQLSSLLLFYALVFRPPGMWDLLPRPGTEPTPTPMQALEGGVFILSTVYSFMDCIYRWLLGVQDWTLPNMTAGHSSISLLS